MMVYMSWSFCLLVELFLQIMDVEYSALSCCTPMILTSNRCSFSSSEFSVSESRFSVANAFKSTSYVVERCCFYHEILDCKVVKLVGFFKLKCFDIYLPQCQGTLSCSVWKYNILFKLASILS